MRALATAAVVGKRGKSKRRPQLLYVFQASAVHVRARARRIFSECQRLGLKLIEAMVCARSIEAAKNIVLPGVLSLHLFVSTRSACNFHSSLRPFGPSLRDHVLLADNITVAMQPEKTLATRLCYGHSSIGGLP